MRTLNFSLFSQFMPNYKNIIYKTDIYLFMVTKLVLYGQACTVSAEINTQDMLVIQCSYARKLPTTNLSSPTISYIPNMFGCLLIHVC